MSDRTQGSESQTGLQPPPAGLGAGDARLEGWKAIAAYLGRTVRTVQRWEFDQSLPLHRQQHNSLPTVYVYQSELDAWRLHRTLWKPPVVPLQGIVPATDDNRTQIRASYYWEKRTLPSLLTAIREFKTALDADPTSAAAYSGLAKTYFALSGNEFWSPLQGYPKARAAAATALKLDSHLPEAHMVLAVVSAFFDGDWDGAAISIDRALAEDSNCAIVCYWRGMIAMNAGRFLEALDNIHRAMHLAPLSAIIAVNVGRPMLCTGQYEEAKQCFRHALTIEPDFWIAHGLLAMADDALGEYDAALQWLECPNSPDANHVMLRATRAQIHARAGATDVARRLLSDLLDSARHHYVSPVRIAQIYAALGQHDEAFAWLNRSRIDRSIRNNTYLPYDYALATLRPDPRFDTCLREYIGR